jgi:hypothetical protein
MIFKMEQKILEKYVETGFDGKAVPVYDDNNKLVEGAVKIKDMKLMCIKNLVLSKAILIMKSDIIEVLNVTYDERQETTDYDIIVVKSKICDDMELTLDITQIADHFEYD